MRNCGSKKTNHGAPYDRCPWSLMTGEVGRYIGWWMDWRALKMLPYRGSMLDQPHPVYESIMIAEDALQYAHSEQMARSAKSAKADGRRAREGHG